MKPNGTTRRRAAQNRELTAAEAADRQALDDSVMGNPDAFLRLVDRHAGRCLTITRQILSDEDLAQNDVRDAFLDLWHHASRFDPVRSPLGPWLVTLAHRRAVDRVRLHDAVPRSTGSPLDLANDIGVEDQSNQNVLGPQTVALLLALPAGQRQCLMLAYWGGYTMTEIGQLLDLPTSTVRTYCSLAMGRLRELTSERDEAIPADSTRRSDGARHGA